MADANRSGGQPLAETCGSQCVPGSGTIAAGWPAAPLIERVAALLATRAAWWSVLAGTCALLLVPLFLVDVPPQLDYPNHLARMLVLASGAHDPILSTMAPAALGG